MNFIFFITFNIFIQNQNIVPFYINILCTLNYHLLFSSNLICHFSLCVFFCLCDSCSENVLYPLVFLFTFLLFSGEFKSLFAF